MAEGKVKKLIAGLEAGNKSLVELMELSGASKNTVKTQMSSMLKKKGYNIVSQKDDKKVQRYSIVGVRKPVHTPPVVKPAA